jgi:hypothetical protein
MDSSKP